MSALNIYETEERMPRAPIPKVALNGVIFFVHSVRAGETLYDVNVKHPVTGRRTVIKRCKSNAPRHYAQDQGNYQVGDQVEIRQIAKSNWEILGFRGNPALWQEGIPSSTINTGRGTLHSDVGGTSVSSGDFTFELSSERAELTGPGNSGMQIEEDKFVLSSEGVEFASDAAGNLTMFDKSSKRENEKFYIVAWQRGTSMTLTNNTEQGGTAAQGHIHPHHHTFSITIPGHLLTRVFADGNIVTDEGVTDFTPIEAKASRPLPAIESLAMSSIQDRELLIDQGGYLVPLLRAMQYSLNYTLPADLSESDIRIVAANVRQDSNAALWLEENRWSSVTQNITDKEDIRLIDAYNESYFNSAPGLSRRLPFNSGRSLDWLFSTHPYSLGGHDTDVLTLEPWGSVRVLRWQVENENLVAAVNKAGLDIVRSRLLRPDEVITDNNQLARLANNIQIQFFGYRFRLYDTSGNYQPSPWSAPIGIIRISLAPLRIGDDNQIRTASDVYTFRAR